MIETPLGINFPTLNYLMAKTSFFVQINDSSDTSFTHKPIGYASGFIVKYHDDYFFVTADHVQHYDDYKIKKRTGECDIFAIHTNDIDKSQLCAKIAPISGVYYFDSFDVSNLKAMPALFDLCICKLKDEQINCDYLTQKIDFPDLILSAGEKKYAITEEYFDAPSLNDTYYLLGTICSGTKGLYFQQSVALHNNLKYVDSIGDYYLLNTETEIISDDNWSGLSGSLVFNQKGGCIGMLSSINVGTKSVWVLSFKKIVPLLDCVYQQEKKYALP